MASSRALYARVGALILAGLALGVGFILFLTSGRVGSDGQLFETYVNESVQGVDVGSPVRYRGVPVGRITEIALVNAVYPPSRFPPPDSEREDAATIRAFQRVLIRFAIDMRRVGEIPSVDEAIRRGLRARIASAGLTGVSYLELDFVDPARYPPIRLYWRPVATYVPAVPSTVAQVTTAAETVLQRLSRIDVEALFGEIGGLIGALRGQLTDGDLAITIRQAGQLAAALGRAVDAAEVEATARAIREAAATIQSAAALIGGAETRTAIGNVATAAQGLRDAMARLPAAVQALEATVRAARAATTDAQADLVPILRDLRAAAANLRDTTELLRRSPSQAIFGAPPPPPDRR